MANPMSELDAAAWRDAMRYRWLRSHNAADGGLFIGMRDHHGIVQFTDDWADDAIDYAMKQQSSTFTSQEKK